MLHFLYMSDYKTISEYNTLQTGSPKEICEFLEVHINRHLKGSTSKIWHKGPVWFIDGNPIVGYWVRKNNEVQFSFGVDSHLMKMILRPKVHLKHLK